MNKMLLKMGGMFRDTDNAEELELFYRLINQKTPDDSKLFNQLDIGNIDISFGEELLDLKDIIEGILNNPSKVQEISMQEIGRRGPKFVELCSQEKKKKVQKRVTKSRKQTESSESGNKLSNVLNLFRIEEQKCDSYQDISCLQMGISRVLAKASIEILGKMAETRIIDYFKSVEKKFKARDFTSDGWVKYAVAEYYKLETAGIIDENGHVLDFTKLRKSPLVTKTPDTFHYAGSFPVQLNKAPSLQASENGNGTQKDMHER